MALPYKPCLHVCSGWRFPWMLPHRLPPHKGFTQMSTARLFLSPLRPRHSPRRRKRLRSRCRARGRLLFCSDKHAGTSHSSSALGALDGMKINVLLEA